MIASYAEASEWPLEDTGPEQKKPAAAKPRLAEVLGIDSWKRFCIKIGNQSYGPFEYNPIVEMVCSVNDGSVIESSILQYAINNPESIIRAQRLTEAEIERCRVYGVKYLTRDKDSAYVVLHAEKAMILSPGYYGEEAYIGHVDAALFPSVNCGDCICVEEAGGEALPRPQRGE